MYMTYAEKHENWSNGILSFAFSFKIWPIVVQTTNMQFKYYCQSGVVTQPSKQKIISSSPTWERNLFFSFCLTSIPILGANPFFLKFVSFRYPSFILVCGLSLVTSKVEKYYHECNIM